MGDVAKSSANERSMNDIMIPRQDSIGLYAVGFNQTGGWLACAV
jgi:hypothetical protein